MSHIVSALAAEVSEYRQIAAIESNPKLRVDETTKLISANALCAWMTHPLVNKHLGKTVCDLHGRIAATLKELEGAQGLSLAEKRSALKSLNELTKAAHKTDFHFGAMIAPDCGPEPVLSRARSVAFQLEAQIKSEQESLLADLLGRLENGGLSTRGELKQWLIQYQYVMHPESDGVTPVPGTVGAGLVAVVNAAMAGEKVGLISPRGNEALVLLLTELNAQRHLEILILSHRAAFDYSQVVEYNCHQLVISKGDAERAEDPNASTYYLAGRALAYFGPGTRSMICSVSSVTGLYKL